MGSKYPRMNLFNFENKITDPVMMTYWTAGCVEQWVCFENQTKRLRDDLIPLIVTICDNKNKNVRGELSDVSAKTKSLVSSRASS